MSHNKINQLRSPASNYYSIRYNEKLDRWTRVKDVTTLTDALLNKLAHIITQEKKYDILDIGCGNLWTAFEIIEKFPNVYVHGIDFAYDAIVSSYPELLNECNERPILFEQADFFYFAPPKTYEIVLDVGLFHHIIPEDWPTYINQLKKVLKPGGSIFLRSFHPSDKNWDKTSAGGHVRKGYYCHYHTLNTLREIFSQVSTSSNEIELCTHFEHVEGLYHFERSTSKASRD